jgi:hypothetical protein
MWMSRFSTGMPKRNVGVVSGWSRSRRSDGMSSSTKGTVSVIVSGRHSLAPADSRTTTLSAPPSASPLTWASSRS